MIQRQLKKQVVQRLAGYPAVALVGPRKCGKTTLARCLSGAYFDLEQEPERAGGSSHGTRGQQRPPTQERS